MRDGDESPHSKTLPLVGGFHDFTKAGHQGVYIESRCHNGAWEFLGIDTDAPYDDERALLVANTAETREYRMRFWDKGAPDGDWSPVQRATAGA